MKDVRKSGESMKVSNSFFKSTNRVLHITCVLLLVVASQALGQQVTVSIGSGSAVSGGTVSLGVTLASSAGALPAALQWTMSYPSSVVVSVSVVEGSSATAAGKSVTCSSTAGATTCLAYGLNQNIISPGVLATATFSIFSSAPSSSVPVQVAAVTASTTDGIAISGSGQGGTISVNQPILPTLSGLSCIPISVNAPGTAACTVTLSSLASTAFSVTLASTNSMVSVPAIVTVPAASLSVTFTAIVAAVPSTQTAILTATAGAISKTFSLSIVVVTSWSISGTLTPSGIGATVTLSGSASSTVTA